jgi:hypothetical protein
MQRTYDSLGALGDGVAEGVEGAVGEGEGGVRVGVKRLLVDTGESDGGHVEYETKERGWREEREIVAGREFGGNPCPALDAS